MSSTVGNKLNYNIDPSTGEVIGVKNDMTFDQRQKDIQLAEKAEEEARERAKRSPYKAFGQLNLDPECGLARRDLIKKSAIAAQVWDFLVEKADNQNAVMCSSTVLEESLGYCRASISKATKLLNDLHFIRIEKCGTANLYVISNQLIWKSWGINLKSCDAKVLIASSEQEKLAKAKTRRTNVVETEDE